MTLLATQYMMSGRFITAEAALRHGLVAAGSVANLGVCENGIFRLGSCR